METFSQSNQSHPPLYLYSTEFTELYPDLVPDTRPASAYLQQVAEASGGLLRASEASLPSFHVGGPGAGAPLHWHQFAFNIQLFGMKRWLLYEERRGLRSRASALNFFDSVLPQLQQMRPEDLDVSPDDHSGQDTDHEYHAKDLGTPLEVGHLHPIHECPSAQ